MNSNIKTAIFWVVLICDHEDDEEQEIGDGRGVPEVEVHEGLLVEVVDEDRGAVERAALGAQVHLVEQLQRVDRQPDDQEQRRRAEQRQGYPAEAPPAVHPSIEAASSRVAGTPCSAAR